jgi:hypothetical protein
MVQELEQKILREAGKAPHQTRYLWQVWEEVTGFLSVTFLTGYPAGEQSRN